MVIESYSESVVEENKVIYLFFGVNSDTVYLIYNLSFLIFVYFFPLACLLISYIFIIYLIRKPNNHLQLFIPSGRRKIKNLRMSLVQVSCFAVFWAPYAIHQTG